MNTEIIKPYSIVPPCVGFHLAQSREATSTLQLLPEELPLLRQVAKRHTVFGRPRKQNVMWFNGKLSALGLPGTILKSPKLPLHCN